MRTIEENSKAIGGLWPEWKPTDEQRSLWRDTLTPLDQDAVFEAVRRAKASSNWREPVLKGVVEAYAEVRRERAEAAKAAKPAAAPEPVPDRKSFEQPEAAVERRLIEDFTGVIEAARPGEFKEIEGRVLDRLGRGLSSVAAYRLLVAARRRLLGQGGPGLSSVALDGTLRPLQPLGGRIPPPHARPSAGLLEPSESEGGSDEWRAAR
jgi:hypothetical protein